MIILCIRVLKFNTCTILKTITYCNTSPLKNMGRENYKKLKQKIGLPKFLYVSIKVHSRQLCQTWYLNINFPTRKESRESFSRHSSMWQLSRHSVMWQLRRQNLSRQTKVSQFNFSICQVRRSLEIVKVSLNSKFHFLQICKKSYLREKA